MKKIGVTVLIVLLLISSAGIIEFSIYKISYIKNKNESDRILNTAYEIIEKQESQKQTEERIENNVESNYEQKNLKETIEVDNDIIGVLVIKKINIEAPIKEGTSQKVMRTAIGHFTESDYWEGNVSFASHNSGTSAHFFEKINTLCPGDEIKYITKLGTKTYKVQTTRTIENTDWSMVLKSDNRDKNTITLITCINGKPDYRLCVRGVEK